MDNLKRKARKTENNVKICIYVDVSLVLDDFLRKSSIFDHWNISSDAVLPKKNENLRIAMNS